MSIFGLGQQVGDEELWSFNAEIREPENMLIWSRRSRIGDDLSPPFGHLGVW